MMIESIVAISLLIALVLYGADQMDIWERETARWGARHALRQQTWDEIERVEYISELM